MRFFWLSPPAVLLVVCASCSSGTSGNSPGDGGLDGFAPDSDLADAYAGDSNVPPDAGGDAIGDGASVQTIQLQVLGASTSTEEFFFQVRLQNLGESVPLDANLCNFHLDGPGSGAFTSCSSPTEVNPPCDGLVVRGGTLVCNVAFRKTQVGTVSPSAKLMYTDGMRSVTVAAKP